MSKTFTRSGLAIAAEANKLTPISNSKSDTFNRLWIWPAKGIVSFKRVANTGDIYIGERTEDQDVTTDVMASGDLPMLIELPQGEQKLLRDVIFQADNAGDGVFFKYW